MTEYQPHGAALADRWCPAACEVLLDDIEIEAHIGALARERGAPQPLRLHVAAGVLPPDSDELALTFDYTLIRAFAIELAAEHIVLIETFALRLARMCLRCDAVLHVEVRIDKPLAVPGCLAGTRVRLARPSA